VKAFDQDSAGPRENRALFRLMAERSGYVLSCLDPNGMLTFVSSSSLQILGYEPEELIGKPGVALVHPDDQEKQRASFAALAATSVAELPPITTRVARKDGTWIDLETVAYVVRDGSGAILEIQAAGREITSRLEAERALEASNANFRAVLEALPEPAVVHYRGKIITANRAFVTLLGWDSFDQLGSELKSGGLKLVHPDDRAIVMTWLGSVLQNGRTPEHRLVHRNGDVIPVEVTGVPFPLDGVVAALAIIHDLRERKRVDAELAAADRMATLGRLASGVGHEINNPLTYVLGALELLRRDIPSSATGPADAERLLARVQQAFDGAVRVRDIVRDLKALSSALEGPPEAVDLHRVLDLAAATAAHEIDHRARLVRDDGVIALVSGRQGRLVQVFVNLLVNAAQAISDGEVDANEIRVVTRMAGESRVTVEVSDTGQGFAPGDAARLFEPYFTTKSGVGTGLGLSIAHRIVGSFGGTIAAEPRSPRGACFRVTLAAYRGEAAREVAVPRITAAVAGPRARVLFADDEPFIRNFASTALDPHEVITAASGREAIDMLKRGDHFDAIVCDLQMPDLGGVDVYEWIVAHRPELADRIAFMTGGAFTERAQQFLARSSCPLIDKPFDLAKMSELIGAIIRR